MDKRLAIIITCTILLAPASLGPADAGSGAVIGSFDHSDGSGRLTEDDTVSTDHGFLLKAPPSASQLRVDPAYLAGRFQDWASDHSFQSVSGMAVFGANDIQFTHFEPDAAARFSWGSHGSIRMEERPMWIRVEQDQHGGRILLDLDDGDTTGQDVYLSRDWLAGKGISRPVIHHEDGTPITVFETVDGQGYRIHVPHFSWVLIDPPEFHVKGRQAGVVFPHQGEIRWTPYLGTVEIDVSLQGLDYELMIPAGWVNSRIPRPIALQHNWSMYKYQDEDHYLLGLTPGQTPTTVVIQERPWDMHRFWFNMTDFFERVDTGHAVTFPVSATANITITLVERHRNSTDMIIHANGTLSPIAGLRDFVASAYDSAAGTNATFTTSENGIAGIICGPEFIYDMSPVDEEFGDPTSVPPPPYIGDILHEGGRRAGLRDCEGGSGPDNSDPEPEPDPVPLYPYNPPPATATRSVMPWLFLEETWRGTFETNHSAVLYAAKAMGFQDAMWSTYTGNSMSPKAYHYEMPDVEPDPNGEDYCEQLLLGFTKWLDDNPFYRAEGRVYILVSGNAYMDCNGSAWACCGTVEQIGRLAEKPDSINYGFNRPGGYHGRTSAEHLGKLIAQEVGHNWGEPNHPCETVKGEYSVMGGAICGSKWDDRKFWLHYSDPAKPSGATDSRQRIIDGTAEYDA